MTLEDIKYVIFDVNHTNYFKFLRKDIVIYKQLSDEIELRIQMDKRRLYDLIIDPLNLTDTILITNTNEVVHLVERYNEYLYGDNADTYYMTLEFKKFRVDYSEKASKYCSMFELVNSINTTISEVTNVKVDDENLPKNIYVTEKDKETMRKVVDLMNDEFFNKLKRTEAGILTPKVESIYANKEKGTIVVKWQDGTSTKVTCDPKDTWDAEKGIAVAVAKKALGNNYNAGFILNKYISSIKYSQSKKNK